MIPHYVCECGRIFFTNVEYTGMIPSKTIDQFEIFEFNLGLLKCASWDAAFLCMYILIFMLLNLDIKQNVKFCIKWYFPQIPQVVFQAVGEKRRNKMKTLQQLSDLLRHFNINIRGPFSLSVITCLLDYSISRYY